MVPFSVLVIRIHIIPRKNCIFNAYPPPFESIRRILGIIYGCGIVYTLSNFLITVFPIVSKVLRAYREDKERQNSLYARLSRNDELQGDSDSIVHRKMLEEFARRNCFPNPTRFTDDGISGARLRFQCFYKDDCPLCHFCFISPIFYLHKD